MGAPATLPAGFFGETAAPDTLPPDFFDKKQPPARAKGANKPLTQQEVDAFQPPTQFEKDRTPQGSALGRFAGGAWDATKGILSGIANLPDLSPTGVGILGAKLAAQIGTEDAQRKQEGRSLPYRGAAILGSAVGVNARGMEEAANRGDSAGILGQAAVPAAVAIGSTLGRPVIKSLGERVATAIPSTERAGAAFQNVMGAARNVPIDVGAVGNTALETQRLAQSGGRMPKVINDFLKRATDPNKGPMTYEEARDFYSNASRLSVDEMNRLTPVMKRQIGKFTAQLRDATEGAASSVGKGDQFGGAMKEYRNAKRLENIGDGIKDAAWNAVKYGIPGGAAILGARRILGQ